MLVLYIYFEVHTCVCVLFSISGYLSGESLPCLTLGTGYFAVN